MATHKPNLRPVNRCIYCGSTSDLTNEHIIPYGLGGDIVLPKSSCKSCSVITSKLEHEILRGDLLAVRHTLNLPTRRPSQRPSTYPVTIIRKGVKNKKMESAEDSIPFFFNPLLPPPASIDGSRNYQGGYDVIGIETITFGTNPLEVAVRHGGDGFSLTANLNDSWLRMIAKIGLGFVVADHGIDSMQHIFVQDMILRKTNDIGMWVGSDDKVLEVEKQGALHSCGTLRRPALEGWDVFLAFVKLFSSAHPTGYLVVVGRT